MSYCLFYPVNFNPLFLELCQNNVLIEQMFYLTFQIHTTILQTAHVLLSLQRLHLGFRKAGFSVSSMFIGCPSPMSSFCGLRLSRGGQGSRRRSAETSIPCSHIYNSNFLRSVWIHVVWADSSGFKVQGL